jgi:sorbitol-specific phosphotransferase system component IIBC
MEMIIDVILKAGRSAIELAFFVLLPVMVVMLCLMRLLEARGILDTLVARLTPLLALVAIDPALILPSLTKYLAGGTAMMGVMDEMRRAGQISVEQLNASAGFLINPFDLPGVAFLISAGRRVGAVWKPAALGGCVGILLRSVGHGFWA